MAQSFWRPLLIIMLFVLFFDAVYAFLVQRSVNVAEISYSRFRSELTADNVKKIRIKGTAVTGVFRAKTKVSQTIEGKELVREFENFKTIMPPLADQTLMADLTAHGVDLTAVSTEASPFINAMIFLVPWLLLLGLWWIGMRAVRSQGPGGMLGGFARSGARTYGQERRSR